MVIMCNKKNIYDVNNNRAKVEVIKKKSGSLKPNAIMNFDTLIAYLQTSILSRSLSMFSYLIFLVSFIIFLCFFAVDLRV